MLKKAVATPRISVLLRATLFLGAGAVLACLGANGWILLQTRSRIVRQVDRLPTNEVGIVLGTSPKLRGRYSNPFFEGRMNSAALLYREGKVRHLLLSGDNHTRGYDEPSAMRDALVARGVPESAMTIDDAGFRTLDSMARARQIFGLRSATIVTDDFHQPRALFLAQASGLQAVGFPSERVPFVWAKKTWVREIGARVKACIDVYLFATRPKFLGRKEPIVITRS